MAKSAPGRHRAPGRHNPLAEISQVVAGASEPAMRTSAVLVATGGLVAAFALPAQAGPDIASATRIAAAAPSLRPLAPAVVAPAAGPVAATYGVLNVKAVAKPKPKPKPKVVVVAPAASRTATLAAASRSGSRLGAPTTSQPAAQQSRPTTSTPSTPSAPSTTSTIPAQGGVLAVAADLVGIPYVYGGSTPAGFDCSGFTQYVFGKVGIALPRTAASQQAAATRVSSPQPGDLIFFGSPAYHVGIYAGNGMMYDSPRTGLSSSLRAVFSGVSGYGRP